MTSRTTHLLSAGLLLIAAVASVLTYNGLPDQVPTHWNAAGEIDGYSGKLTAVLIGPAGAAATWLIMWLLPYISPKGFRTEGFQGTVHVIQLVIMFFMTGIGGIIIAAGYGYEAAVERIVPVACGALFVVVGNYLGKTRKNFFIGIRTPWTLASDEVWMRTHRLGGYLFVIGGIAMMIIGLLELGHIPFMVAAIGAGLIPFAYSFVAYRQLEGFSNDAQDPE
ncbi:MAG: SdpI family protein [Pseudomonadota bacterium]